MKPLRMIEWVHLRWATTMITFGGVVFLTYRDDIIGPLLNGLTSLTANMVFVVLNWLDLTVAQEATVIYQPNGFAYEIYFSCTGVLPVAFMTVSMLAYPAPLRHKLLGLAVSVPLLIAINLTRLLHLFWVGITRPEVFEFVHHVLWEGVIILSALAIWLVWLKWSYAHSEEWVSS